MSDLWCWIAFALIIWWANGQDEKVRREIKRKEEFDERWNQH